MLMDKLQRQHEYNPELYTCQMTKKVDKWEQNHSLWNVQERILKRFKIDWTYSNIALCKYSIKTDFTNFNHAYKVSVSR